MPLRRTRKVVRNTSVIGASYTAGFAGSVAQRHVKQFNKGARIKRMYPRASVRVNVASISPKDFKRAKYTAIAGFGSYRVYRHVKKKRQQRRA